MRNASWLAVTGAAAVLALNLAGCRIEVADSGRPPGARTAVDSLAIVEQDSARREEVRRVLRAYYRRFSDRDWREFRQSFWDGATITAKYLPRGERTERVVTQTVEAYVRAVPEGPDRLAVFEERPVSMDIHLYGDLAQAWVVYRARIGATRDSVTAHHGIDAFHLMRQRGVYRIVSVSSVTETPDRPLVPAAPPAPGAAPR
jgi:hypothetical protein